MHGTMHNIRLSFYRCGCSYENLNHSKLPFSQGEISKTSTSGHEESRPQLNYFHYKTGPLV